MWFAAVEFGYKIFRISVPGLTWPTGRRARLNVYGQDKCARTAKVIYFCDSAAKGMAWYERASFILGVTSVVQLPIAVLRRRVDTAIEA